MKHDYLAEQEQLRTRGLSIELPVPKRPILSDTRNIEYAINTIIDYQRRYSVPIAITYKLMRGWGTKEKFYKLFPKDAAIQRAKERTDEEYITLDILLKRKRDVEEGKLCKEGTRILGLSEAPSY